MPLGRIARTSLAITALLLIATVLPGGAAEPSATPVPVTVTDGMPRSLPRDLVPSLADAPRIRPRAYADGCHAKAGDTRARVCRYGVEGAPFSVLLIGDSHAVQWLPALEALADQEGWRLYSLTKSACPVPDTPVIVRGKRLRDCDRWRDAAFERISELHPDLVVAASLGRIYELPGGDTRERHDRRWRAAWARSLEALHAGADAVVLLGDTPMWTRDPIACLRRHRRDIGRCDTPQRDALSSRTDAMERAAAKDASVPMVPTADLVCPRDPCRAVEDRYLVLGDTQHMTVAWARHIAPELLERFRCAGVAIDASVPFASPDPAGLAVPDPSPASSPVPSPEQATLAAPSGAPSLTPGATSVPSAPPMPGCPP